jgi:hypothetical protein
LFKRLAIIALLCVPFVSARSYEFIVADKAQIGAAQLKPGQYTLTLKGSQAVLRDQNGRRTEAAVKIEAADSAFPDTLVVLSTTGGSPKVEYIGLKGTKNKVVFQ